MTELENIVSDVNLLVQQRKLHFNTYASFKDNHVISKDGLTFMSESVKKNSAHVSDIQEIQNKINDLKQTMGEKFKELDLDKEQFWIGLVEIEDLGIDPLNNVKYDIEITGDGTGIRTMTLPDDKLFITNE